MDFFAEWDPFRHAAGFVLAVGRQLCVVDFARRLGSLWISPVYFSSDVHESPSAIWRMYRSEALYVTFCEIEDLRLA